MPPPGSNPPGSPAPGSSELRRAAAPMASLPELPLAYRPWLHRFAVLIVLAVLPLLALGGQVTSMGAGLAVPDWPNSFDYIMWFTPYAKWSLAHHPLAFLEHTHRLFGSLVGLLAIVLAIWLPLSQKGRGRRWLAWLGPIFLLAVIAQGVMGGLRVDLVSETWALFHGIFGQIIFALAILIAAATSKLWLRLAAQPKPARSLIPAGLRYLSIALLAAVLFQIGMGSWIRHRGAALAIPDFPLSFGQLMPPMTKPEIDQAEAAWYKAHPEAAPKDRKADNPAVNPPIGGKPASSLRLRSGVAAAAAPVANGPDNTFNGGKIGYTVRDVAISFGHRSWAYIILALSLGVVIWLAVVAGGRSEVKWPARSLIGLLLVQIMLGAMIIWTQRFPHVATTHQVTGAVILGVVTLLAIRIHLLARVPRSFTTETRRHGEMQSEQEELVA